MTHFMIIGSINFYVASEPTRLKLDQADEEQQSALTKNSIKDAGAHVSELILNALLKGSR